MNQKLCHLTEDIGENYSGESDSEQGDEPPMAEKRAKR
jgi:hypothetical protein